MNEKEIKFKLASLLSKDFYVMRNVKLTHFTGKTVVPDLAFKLNEKDNMFFVVEIKDDTAKNFNLPNLLHQAVDYKNSNLNGVYPSVSFICTYNLLKNKSNFDSKLIGFAAKLGVGKIYCVGSGDDITFQIAIGSNIFYKYNVQTCNSEHISFDRIPSINIGTWAKSNKKPLNTP